MEVNKPGACDAPVCSEVKQNSLANLSESLKAKLEHHKAESAETQKDLAETECMLKANAQQVCQAKAAQKAELDKKRACAESQLKKKLECIEKTEKEALEARLACEEKKAQEELEANIKKN